MDSNLQSIDEQHLSHAIQVARRARGFAEPNPTVGCVIAVGDQVIAEGWTQAYGSDHAEVHAIGRIPADQQAALAEATMYVTLEPCCHHGKTPPCTDAILSTPIKRVVVALEDPFPKVAGQGIQRLREAGLDVTVGLCEQAANRLIAPYLKLQQQGRPWVIAKWAMTLDGRIATKTADSQWISSPASREVVHQIRGRVDAIMVGIGTALADNPRLTARLPGEVPPRVATRIVVDSKARLPLDSDLVKTASDVPVLLAVGPEADKGRLQMLRDQGVAVWQSLASTHAGRLNELMGELGSLRMTNVLVEGGGQLMGGLWDAQLIDEVHVFIAPKIAGGQDAIAPLAGNGIEWMRDAIQLQGLQTTVDKEGDVYVRGFINQDNPSRIKA